jgi:hypothetical protein
MVSTTFELDKEHTKWTNEREGRFIAVFKFGSYKFIARVLYENDGFQAYLSSDRECSPEAANFVIAFKTAILEAHSAIKERGASIKVDTMEETMFLEMKEDSYGALVKAVFEYLQKSETIVGGR